jgi:Uma2 family endonuclease
MHGRGLIPPRPAVDYPESDDEPMAENTVQYRWIVTLKENLEVRFQERDDVFVAADLFWYPVEGNNTIRQAPDVLTVFGRPKGDRGSYRQWEEGGIAPQVIFEILSPGNRPGQMAEKFQFYQRYGVDEYYIYDPDDNTLEGWRREAGTLRPIAQMSGWISPLLGIRFELVSDSLRVYHSDGSPFLTFAELAQLQERARREADAAQQQARAAEQQARAAEQQARAAEQQATAAEHQTQRERERAERLAAQLRALGIEPDA